MQKLFDRRKMTEELVRNLRKTTRSTNEESDNVKDDDGRKNGSSKLPGHDFQTSGCGRRSQRRGISKHASTYVGVLALANG